MWEYLATFNDAAMLYQWQSVATELGVVRESVSTRKKKKSTVLRCGD